MTTGESKDKRPVLQFHNSKLVIGAKFWWACGIGAVIIVVGVCVTPQNGWAGLGIGLAGVLGAVLGALLQATPKDQDFTTNGASAVRGLLVIAEDLENARILATQLVNAASPQDERISLGLMNVQDRLLEIRPALYMAMAEWDSVAPGSLDEVNRLQDEGKRAFAMLAKQVEENG